MKLKVIDVELSVCKVWDYSGVNLNQPYVFTGATDEENPKANMMMSPVFRRESEYTIRLTSLMKRARIWTRR